MDGRGGGSEGGGGGGVRVAGEEGEVGGGGGVGGGGPPWRLPGRRESRRCQVRRTPRFAMAASNHRRHQGEEVAGRLRHQMGDER